MNALVYIKNNLWIISGFLIFSIVYIFIDGGMLWDRFFSLGVRAGEIISWSEYLSKRIVFLLFHFLAIWFLFAITISGRLALKYIVLILYLFLIIIDLTYYFISHKYAGLTEISLLNDAIGNTEDAIKEYFYEIFKATLLSTTVCAFLVMFGLQYKSPKPVKKIFIYAIIPLLILLTAYTSVAIRIGEPALVGFPRGFSYGIGSMIIWADKTRVKYSNTNDEIINPHYFESLTSLKNIIVIMDESIEGEHFNRISKNANFNHSVKFTRVFSGANISASSNYFFRRASLINTQPVATPSLFNLAKDANYTTYFIDAQSVLKDINVRNYFDNIEISFIDHVFDYSHHPREQRDFDALIDIQEILKNNKKSFIFMNKIGAHIPYKDTLPVHLQKGNKKELYEASIKRNAVQFLEKLIIISKQENAFIFYTSDHGQNLNGGATHGNTGKDVRDEEWKVPFLVFSPDPQLHDQLEGIQNKNPLITHFEITESIRNILGYEIKGMNSIFKGILDRKNFCAFYGSPKPLLGSNIKCKMLYSIP